MKHVRKTLAFGRHQLSLETGEIARQASGAVMVSLGETVVLVTVVGARDAKPGQDFFPLTVDYQERSYAAGRIPGGFFKREGRPSEKEILTSRLMDRPLRPLFPDGFYHEVQVVATVLSADPEVDPDIPSMIGAAAALAVSGIPFNGPVGAARVGRVDGAYVLNPTATELTTASELDLMVAGTRNAVLMVESEARELSEEVMLGAVVFGHQAMQPVLDAIDELAREAGVEPWDWAPAARDEALVARVAELGEAPLRAAYGVVEKQTRTSAVAAARNQVVTAILGEGADADEVNHIKGLIKDLEARIVRGQILDGRPRIDGRDARTVRPITIRTGVLPRTHGSVLFTRGETQSLAVATLGTGRDEQIIDALGGEYHDRFMLHYNMPPYATGECGRVGSPKRREIGHGRLAKRALIPVLPPADRFGYTMRVVSEITESNGSSSMASVCGGCLALMDAGVPLSAHVAGIAMGLIKEGERHTVLTDILGDEDHLGDMDFKVAGTRNGITALQMDIKIDGITTAIMETALHQAREGRLHILDRMVEALPGARTDVSTHAPRIMTMRIKPDKIRDVIGKGGAVIRALTEETNSTIDIAEDGTVTIFCTSADGGERARARIEAITTDVEVGKTYEGTVLKLLDFGAIVSVLPGRDGLLHISQIAHERVAAVTDHLKEGQLVNVKVIETDDKGRIKLSMKALVEAPEGTATDAGEEQGRENRPGHHRRREGGHGGGRHHRS